MSTKNDNEIDQLLDGAERVGRCLFAPEGALRRACRRRVLSGQLDSPHPGLFVRQGYWDALNANQRVLHVIRGLANLHPAWVFCFASAAAVHGLETSYLLANEVHVIAQHASSAARRGEAVKSGYRVIYHALSVRDEDIERVDGVSVTAFDRTVFDCVRILSFPLGLAIADSALRRGGCSRGEVLENALNLWPGCVGAARFATVMRWANPLSENGGESYARAIMLENGVAEPELQYEYVDRIDPAYVYRVDCRWEMKGALDVGGELDGIEKTSSPEMLRGKSAQEALRKERERESRLALDVRLARFTFAEARAVKPLIQLLDAFGVPRGIPCPELTLLRDASAVGPRYSMYAELR